MWTVPRMWDGDRCFILGGGPSMYKQLGVPEEIVQQVLDKKADISIYNPFFDCIKKEHIIGVNIAYKFGGWVDMVFFGDSGFWKTHKYELTKYPGIKVSISPDASAVKVLLKARERYGLTSEPNKLVWNGNSGAAAINLAVHTGVKQIILLGFDMTLGEKGNQHWHKEYIPQKDPQAAFNKHLACFPRVADNAKKMGVEILNANPDSAIKEFKKVNLKDVL